MTDRPPRLARNVVLAGLAVLATAAAVIVAASPTGPVAETCPAGQHWVEAQPVGVLLTQYGLASSTQPVTTAEPTNLRLAGCVDIDRLHPLPIPIDGRG